jgi:hypothetical protein
VLEALALLCTLAAPLSHESSFASVDSVVGSADALPVGAEGHALFLHLCLKLRRCCETWLPPLYFQGLPATILLVFNSVDALRARADSGTFSVCVPEAHAM